VQVPTLDGGDPLAPHSLAPRELKELLRAERSECPFLAFRAADERLVLFELDSEIGKYRLGRKDQMDVAIAWDGEVSSVHAEVECVADEWTLVDDGLSRNGTYVNGERLAGRHRLRDGDRIRIGRTVLVYNSATPVGSATTVTAGDTPPAHRLTDGQRRVLIALCRPYRERSSFATPASNHEIAGELFLSVAAVKMQLRALFNEFGLADLPQNQKRARLAEYALRAGLVTERDLG
jgi:FHA domain